MSEERAYILGKKPKMISFIRDNNYVRAVCKLKENVDYFKLNEFFNRVYSLRLDDLGFNCFSSIYSTADLIKCLHMILEEVNLINLKDLCLFIGNSDNENRNIYPILIIIKDFFDMFEIVEREVIPLNNYNNVKLFVLGTNDNFSCEVESLFYNSRIFECICSEKVMELKKRVC